jgi:hypothetical protein
MKYSFSDKRIYKLAYYLSAIGNGFVNEAICRNRISKAILNYKRIPQIEKDYIINRVNYYNRLSQDFDANKLKTQVANYRREKSWAYHLDFKPLIKCFPESYRFNYLFGDITEIPSLPTFLKSRPITDDKSNANSVLLKLNKIRHYYMPKDPLSFEDKKPLAVWRGKAFRDNRESFIRQHHASPLCDIGDTRAASQGQPWHKPFMPIHEQLRFRYIVSIEGKDVASNLKWAMASNSVCLMPKPNYETWFMEGALIPGKHYVQIKDDFSDLEQKINRLIIHPHEALEIVVHANKHANQFNDTEREFLISIMVMDKYFKLTGKPSILSMMND